MTMALTRSFRETVKDRVQRDAAFREAILLEAIEVLLSGDVQTGKALLRDFINATIGFDELSQRTGTPAKSLMRMFGASGNPTARTLFSVIRELQETSGVVLQLQRAA